MKTLQTPRAFSHLNPQLTRTLVDQAIHEKQPNNVLAKKVLSPIEKALKG